MRAFIEELRRRKVIRTTTYYLGAAWVLIGACDIFFPMFGIADGVLRVVIYALLAGIPIVLGMSWFFEFSPADGVTVDAAEPQTQRAQRSVFDLLLIAVLGGALSVSVFVNLRQGTLFVTKGDVPLVAVMPFVDVSEAGAHISFGIAEELLNLLVREPNIRVVSAANSFEFAGRGMDLIAAARRLNADFIIRGSVSKQGNEFRLIVRLLDVASGEVVWSDDFLGQLDQIFIAQIRVAAHVAQSLNLAIEYAFSTDQGRLNPQAVDLYLQAQETLRTASTLEAMRAAGAELETAMTLQPDFSAGMGTLCRTYMMVFTRTEDPADYQRSAAKCLESLTDDPDSPHTKLALATLYNNAGEHAEAKELALEITAQLPNYEPAYNQLGQAEWRLGNLEAAEKAFRDAVAIHDRDWSSYLSLGNFFALTQRYQEAIAPFTKITELMPDDFVGYASLGVTHFEAGNLDQARALTLQALAINQNSRGYFNLGLIENALDDQAAAAAAFENAVKLNPQNYRAQMFRSGALQKQGKDEAAQVAKRKALEIIEGLMEVNPNAAYVLSNGAAILSELGDAARAIEWAERARTLDARDPKVQLNVGVTYYQTGDEDRGIEELRRALEMGYPKDLFASGEIEAAILEHPRIAALLAN